MKMRLISWFLITLIAVPFFWRSDFDFDSVARIYL